MNVDLPKQHEPLERVVLSDVVQGVDAKGRCCVLGPFVSVSCKNVKI